MTASTARDSAKLARDVWERAYYIDYGSHNRGRSLDAFSSMANWKFAAKQASAAAQAERT